MIACAVFIVTQHLPQMQAPKDYRIAAQEEKVLVPGTPPAEKPQAADQIATQKKDIPVPYASPADKIQAANRLAALQERAPVQSTFPADKLKYAEQIAAQKANAPTLAASPAIKTQVAEQIAGGMVGGVVGGIIAPKEDALKLRSAVAPSALPPKDEERSAVKAEGRPAEIPAPALKYRLLRRGGDGQFQEVSRDMQFASSDAVRVVLEPQTSGYLAVAELAENNTWRLIFPLQSGTAAHIPEQASITLPVAGVWEFGSPPRERRLFAVLTTQPQAALVAEDGSLLRPQIGTILEILLRVSP
jgi:hypothetical protein